MTLSKLITSLHSATSALEGLEDVSLNPDGISLLDVKSELLLSYLQNLVFLLLLRIRSSQDDQASEPIVDGDHIITKLVELRLHLEKGVRPLEARMKYQIDKAVRAAETSIQREIFTKQSSTVKASNDDNDDESEDDDSDATAGVADEAAFRPNLAAFTQKPSAERAISGSTDARPTDGIYRPPRIAPTVLSQPFSDRQKTTRKSQRSHTLDEYIDTELSHAPVAQPSIGSTIVAGGRHTKSDRERREEAERTNYEESNFTRLPPISKKEKARKAARSPVGFGGEELRGLGEGLDRIGRLTARKGSSRAKELDDGPSRSSGGSRGPKRRKVGRR